MGEPWMKKTTYPKQSVVGTLLPIHYSAMAQEQGHAMRRGHVYCNLCHVSSSELISETYYPQPDFLRSWWLCSAQHSHPTWCPCLNGIHLVAIKLGKPVLCFGTLATNSSKAHRLRGHINKVHTLSSNKSPQNICVFVYTQIKCV